MVITLSDGTTQTVTGTSGTPQPFVGFTSPVNIASLSIVRNAPVGHFSTINNLYVGAAAAVPEPGSVALLAGMSALGAAFLRRRKQAHKAV